MLKLRQKVYFLSDNQIVEGLVLGMTTEGKFNIEFYEQQENTIQVFRTELRDTMIFESPEALAQDLMDNFMESQRDYLETLN